MSKYKAIGGPCDHEACIRSKTGCKQYVPEVFEVTEEDQRQADALVSQYWMQVSNKYRLIGRWRNQPPCFGRIVADEEFLVSLAGKHLERIYNDHIVNSLQFCEDFEHLELSPSLFKAFKIAKLRRAT